METKKYTTEKIILSVQVILSVTILLVFSHYSKQESSPAVIGMLVFGGVITVVISTIIGVITGVVRIVQKKMRGLGLVSFILSILYLVFLTVSVTILTMIGSGSA